MSVNISKLHGVLRDPTRAKILQLLDERTSLSYGELQSLLQITHTGKLNYHLKVLGDLLVKDNLNGRYSLGEKGKIAAQLLSKFQTLADESAARKNLMIGSALVALIAAVILLAYLTQYVIGFSGIGQTIYAVGWAGAGLFATWLFGKRSPLRVLLRRG
jgi:DNA-binding transcriptional ArsR family regulator